MGSMPDEQDPGPEHVEAVSPSHPLDGPDQIVRRFRAKGQISSETVEGFNTKAKLTARKSYGLRTFKIQEIALYHSLGNLPVPDWINKFS